MPYQLRPSNSSSYWPRETEGLGINPRNKEPGGIGKDRWEAGVYIEMGDRTTAIELQRSYQHLGDFVARQKRYARYGVGWPDTPR